MNDYEVNVPVHVKVRMSSESNDFDVICKQARESLHYKLRACNIEDVTFLQRLNEWDVQPLDAEGNPITQGRAFRWRELLWIIPASIGMLIGFILFLFWPFAAIIGYVEIFEPQWFVKMKPEHRMHLIWIPMIWLFGAMWWLINREKRQHTETAERAKDIAGVA